MHLLIVEDDKQIGKFLKDAFEQDRFMVDWAKDGEEGSHLAQAKEYDLVILDNMLPKRNGSQVCKDIRKAKKYTPILVLSVICDADEKVGLLEFGADDYLTKPFSYKELKARVRALLRRPPVIEDEKLAIGDIQVNISQHKVTCLGKEVRLTNKEFMLFEYLIRNKGRVVSRSMIAEHVWDNDLDLFSNTIETHILKIRKKLGMQGANTAIKTILGRGYKLDESFIIPARKN